MNAKYTPGPWEFFETPNDPDFTHEVSGIAAIYATKNESSANARLIAAAPELLDVAMSILADDMLQYLPAEYVAKVRATISKATGEQ